MADGLTLRNQRSYGWENTQKLLWSKGVNGIKTGITTTAGPCLATSITKDDYDLIIILLNCKTVESRWIETNKLANWCIARMKRMKNFQNSQQQQQSLMSGNLSSLPSSMKSSSQINSFE